MRITADTNVLLRALLADDEAQQKAAIEALEKAELVAIGPHALCELVWVLDRRYRVSRADIAASIRRLTETRNVAVNRPAVEAGLGVLEAGGDFADGVIVHEGQWLGGETFVSFDRKAVKRIEKQGGEVRLLGAAEAWKGGL